ncbi:MAG TPA: SDR family oxidoreductase [Acidimicrobiales bacterium]|nr:SDR family oxidoreductase [Acidimicrobiales bacterium]
MNLEISGKVAIVTGASKGLGFGAAKALSEEGCRVVLCARGADELEKAAAQLPGESLTVAADVTQPGVPAQLVAAAMERFGSVDIVVGNSGGPPPGRALDVTDDAIAAAVNANLTTSVRLVRESVPHMRANHWGRICLITSFSIKEPIPTLALSNLARTGLWAWAKTAAADLFPDGITLNLLAPGLHATERAKNLGVAPGTPMGDPDDFGKIVAFFCSEPAKFVTGTALPVDGGAVRGLL